MSQRLFVETSTLILMKVTLMMMVEIMVKRTMRIKKGIKHQKFEPVTRIGFKRHLSVLTFMLAMPNQLLNSVGGGDSSTEVCI